MSDLISRQAAQHKINALIDEFETIMKDIRERHVDDSVCGLCEYDGAFMSDSGNWCNECPGFERDDCFKLKDQYREEWAGAIKNLPPVQPETLASGEGELNVPEINVGDMISRQVAMERLMAQNVIMDGSEYHNGFNAGVNRAQEVIRNLPSVQPKRGKWNCTDDIYENAECSCCKWDSGEAWSYAWANFNFCPSCGAKMER